MVVFISLTNAQNHECVSVAPCGGINRSEHPPLLLQITSSPRSKESKVELFRLLAEELEKQGIQKEDLFISISPTQREDWSFGNGVAQLLQEEEETTQHKYE